MVMECIYEPTFKDTSHGFRPGRSQHTALRDIRKNFGGVIWTVQGNISKCFDMVDHEILMGIIEKKIQDYKFNQLIRAGLKARVVLPGGEVYTSTLGTAQGGVLSPLLSNIYLHSMDE